VCAAAGEITLGKGMHTIRPAIAIRNSTRNHASLVECGDRQSQETRPLTSAAMRSASIL